MPGKKIKVLNRVVNIDGKEIHVLTRNDGRKVTEKQLQDYVSSINVNKLANKQLEANRIAAEQKKRFDEFYKNKDADWKVPSHLYKEFVFDLNSGLSFCARKYKVPQKQILIEAKRIAPHMNVATLRE